MAAPPKDRAQTTPQKQAGKLPRSDDPRQIAAIERGLDLLLRNYHAVTNKPPDCPDWVETLHDDLHGVTRDEDGTDWFTGNEIIYAPGYELILDLMGENPARASLRNGVRLLGEQIYFLTKSEDAMLDVLERVAALDPPTRGLRVDVMSKAWDQIGNWFA